MSVNQTKLCLHTPCGSNGACAHVVDAVELTAGVTGSMDTTVGLRTAFTSC